ncbi:hypothetical protein E8A74_46950 [Polyangium fumosum]|uniref:Uncharacterized protein n=1 Tax=Polyangium fumosum TaxID=889272 RepID=A0A4U1IML7_9BACT|nr:hypothetical protein E8A74_46950 [Polyangium fumosum]
MGAQYAASLARRKRARPHRRFPRRADAAQGASSSLSLATWVHWNVREFSSNRSLLPRKVYDYGFDPLADGFQATPDGPFKVFDQWVEVLPTDQLVAVQVEYDPVTGRLVTPPEEP